MKKFLTLIILAGAAFTTAAAQWNTNATPVCIFDGSNRGIDYVSTVKAVRTPDKKTWIAWRSLTAKQINGVNRSSARTLLQLLDRDGVPQFEEPIVVNDYATPSYWSEYGLGVAADGSVIVTVADGRAQEAILTPEVDNISYFTPAIYKIDQEGNFLWGIDGVEYRQFTEAAYTNAYVVGNDTYFIFFNNSFDGTGVADDMSMVGTFIQRINDDGTVAWDAPKKWGDGFEQPQIVPSTDGEFLLFDRTPDGSRVQRLNRDLELVWDEPVIYDPNKYEGYEMNHYKLASDGQGGAAVAFVRNMGQFAHNVRVARIDASGATTFGMEGLDVANTEDNDYDYCKIAVNPKTEEILVDFESSLESSYDVMLQKFSFDGDYLFNEMGISIASKDRSNAYAFGSVGSGALENGDWIVAYRTVAGYFNASFVIRRYDKDGNQLWTRTIGREIDPSTISFFVEEEASYLVYEEEKSTKQPGVKIFRIGNDGSYNVNYSDDDQAVTSISAANGEPEAIYSPDGKQLTAKQKGINIVRMSDGTVKKEISDK